MLIIVKDEKASPPKFTLSGVIDETTDFRSQPGELGAAADFYCKDVGRINSVGIKIWREFFEAQRKKNVKIKFFDISPALVTTLNYISDFMHKDEIQTFCAPFHCTSCKYTTFKIYAPATIEELSKTLENVVCEKCSGPTEFDELPEEYFSFLQG